MKVNFFNKRSLMFWDFCLAVLDIKDMPSDVWQLIYLGN